MTQNTVINGLLDLSLIAARFIVQRNTSAERVIVICQRVSPIAKRYLQRRFGDRLDLRVLDVDPYYLPAQHLCDKYDRNFRCDAIESVIDVAHLLGDKLWPDVTRNILALNLSGCEDILRRYVRHQIGEFLKNQVYLGYHLMSISIRAGGNVATLLLPEAWWADSVKTVLAPSGLRVDTYRPSHGLWAGIRWVISRSKRFIERQGIIRAASDEVADTWPDTIDANSFECGDPCQRGAEWNGPYVSGMVCDGVDARLRNNVGWAWCSDLPLGAFVFLWNVLFRGPTRWERMLPERGVRVVALVLTHLTSGFLHPLKTRTRLAARVLGILLEMGRVFIRLPEMLVDVQKRWLGMQCAILMERAHPWRMLFENLQIKVHVEFDYGVDAYARAIGMRSTGGIVVLDQRSQYYDNYDHTSDRSGDLAFVSGPHGLRYFSPRRFVMPPIIVTGLSIDGGNGIPKDMAVKRDISLPSIVVFDEPGVLYGSEHVRHFITAIIEHCHEHGGYQVIFKPKRRDGLARQLSADTVVKLKSLLSAGRCRILPAEVSVYQACWMASLVVSVPSTAVCIAIGAGTPTLVYNPYRTIRTMFYEFGLDGRCIFETLGGVLRAVGDFFEGRDPYIGACGSVRSLLDPWLDMSGNGRKGFLISMLVRGFSKGYSRVDAVKQALAQYRDKFGPETAGEWRDVWGKFRGDESGLMSAPPRYDRAVLVPAS